MPEPRGEASVKTMDATKRRLFRPTATGSPTRKFLGNEKANLGLAAVLAAALRLIVPHKSPNDAAYASGN